MWYFYLINLIQNTDCFLSMLSGLFIVMAVINFIAIGMHNDFNKSKQPYSPAMKWIYAGIVSGLLTVPFPNKETMYLMASAKAVEVLATTPEASKAREVINLGLDKILTNLKDK